MRALLISLIALVFLAWGWDVFVVGSQGGGSLPWVIRQEALYLSGLLSIAMMSLAVFLAARPIWLEGALGGLDRLYRTHKWAGILAGGFAVVHWLIEMSDDLLKAMIGREGRVPKESDASVLTVLRDLAEDMGELALYSVLFMLVLTLWKRLSYRPWRILHQATPALYLILAFHAALLAPADYWRQPVGVLLVLLLFAGVYGSACSLAGRIGRSHQVSGKIVRIEHPAPGIVSVSCRLDQGWHGHRPGQFAFITFDKGEGAHPFTIASADRGDRTLDFQIKALGDYTGGLANWLQTGLIITIEGPYGRFNIGHHDHHARQIWVAAGIGVTPFLAWLESLQLCPEINIAADLHYCTQDRNNDPFVVRLASLCAHLPGIRLRVYGSRQGERLIASGLKPTNSTWQKSEIWFCGPQGLADSLKKGLLSSLQGEFQFHQELFEMR